MKGNWSPVDPVTELRFALAEAETVAPAGSLRDRMLSAAVSERAPGLPVQPADHINGVEAFRRLTSRLNDLLLTLDASDWARPTVRDLDVQQLMGHLIGVEEDFISTLRGDTAASDADHVDSTQRVALRQKGRRAEQTRRDWQNAVGETIALVEAERDVQREIRFYSVPLPLDAWLVARAFEVWIHEEDIRRAVGQQVADPDPETLTRMTDLATLLLPAGISSLESRPEGAHARLVLTGPGGGTWDVPLGGERVVRARPGRQYEAHVVVDAADFCRVVGNRADLARSGAIVREDADVAGALFAGAAALAFD